MNFLAHLHLAHLSESSLQGNLLADFVRGNPADSYSADIVAGIHLHRRIDVMTDRLPEVAKARQWFRASTRRVAPIALDIVWDHFLSRHWQKVHPATPLTDFVAYARSEIAPRLSGMPASFIHLNQHLWDERWLERYGDMQFIARVLAGMAKRRPRLAQLTDSWYDLDAHYDALEALFWSFYPRMMEQAEAKGL